MIDYIIVGCGLAGTAFAEMALQNNKSILVFDNASQPSSTVAGGMYNPVVLKRFTAIWKAQEQLELVHQFYTALESKLQIKCNYPLPLWRKFASVEEQNNWFSASDKPSLSNFLETKIRFEKISGIEAPFGFGEVAASGYLDIKELIQSYQRHLKQNNLFSSEAFQYEAIEFKENYIQYKDNKVRHIIFAEGFGLHENPFFKQLPLDGTKGELLHIKSNNLQLNKIVKSNIFILPIGNNTYKVGATYNWKDKTNAPTTEGKIELIEKLNELISCDYQIVAHLAGVRPTVNDRRPLVGTHPIYNNLHILNGLGTRGVMLAPFLAKNLWNYLENKIPLDKEIDCSRYFV
ncbi:NAD(P)/FAD-dependent oxidoreductase [Flavobacterium sp.]|uniref:NAD(P)/FAD-dependent oxidoreductase n=1 Tax=Flavobacterium sp. TaxID=239 RepID=UPI0035293799